MAATLHDDNEELQRLRYLQAGRAELAEALPNVNGATTKAMLTFIIGEIAAAEYALVASVVCESAFDRRCASDTLNDSLRRIPALIACARASEAAADPHTSLTERQSRIAEAVAAIHEQAFSDHTGDS
jgi:hypothetical protein